MDLVALRIVSLLAAVVGALSPLHAENGSDANGPQIEFNIRYERCTHWISDGTSASEDEAVPTLTIRQLTRQIDRSPSAKAYSERAVLQEMQGNRDCAVSDITKAIEIEPSWRLYFMRSIFYLMENEGFKARIDIESAMLVVPEEDAAVANAMAGLLSESEETSVERLTKAIELTPKSPDYLLMRSHRYLRLKRPLDTIADIRAAMKLGHDSVFARFYLSLAYRRAGDWESAIEEYAKAFEKFPESLVIARARAKFLMDASSRLKEEQNLLDSAIRCCDLTEWEDAGSLILLGDAYRKADDKEAAIEAYREAKKFADDSQLDEIISAIKQVE